MVSLKSLYYQKRTSLVRHHLSLAGCCWSDTRKLIYIWRCDDEMWSTLQNSVINSLQNVVLCMHPNISYYMCGLFSDVSPASRYWHQYRCRYQNCFIYKIECYLYDDCWISIFLDNYDIIDWGPNCKHDTIYQAYWKCLGSFWVIIYTF